MSLVEDERDLEPISRREKFWLWVMRGNGPIVEFKRSGSLWRFKATFSWRSSKNAWGRFGGGWQWKLGFSIGTTTVLIHLLVADLMISYKKEGWKASK